MTQGPSLAELRAELAGIRNRQDQRARDAKGLGLGACNLGHDLDIMAEVRREELAAELARIAELEAAIAVMEAELPNSPERQADVWGQLEARRRRPQPDDAA